MRIAFVDVETTGSEPWIHELWEVAILEVEFDFKAKFQRRMAELFWLVEPQSLEVASPRALQINGFYDRTTPEPTWDSVHDAALEIAKATADLRLAGCNVGFDLAFLTKFMIGEFVVPTWHYSPIDIKSLAYGRRRSTFGMSTSELLKAYGVDVQKCLAYHAPHFDRHSATADAYLAYELFNRVMGFAQTYPDILPERPSLSTVLRAPNARLS